MYQENPHEAKGEKTPLDVRARLCLMMFLQYFVQGCYLPIASVYVQDALGFSPIQVGYFGMALAIGPLAAPFIIGQLVDRFWPTQYVLAASHLAGGLLMLALFTQTGFWPVIIIGTLYSVLYVPSMMLSNSLAFSHLKNRAREFPIIRLFGTIGFVVPAWLIEMWWLAGRTGGDLNMARGIAFCFSGIAGLIMGFYAISLPHTPPDAREDRRWAPVAVIEMLRFRYFAVLVLITFLISMVHKFYFVWNGPFLTDVLRSGNIQGAWEQRISSIGQISEVLVMAVVGLSIARLGFKWTLLIGAVGYLARCVVLAAALGLEAPFPVTMSLACLGQALHGVCFGCFLAVAFIFVDKISPADIRGSMQNVFGTFVIGLGFLAGGYAAGQVGNAFTTDIDKPTMRQSAGIESPAGVVKFVNKDKEEKYRDWPGIWLACGALAAVCVVGLGLLFPRQTPADEGEGPEGTNEKTPEPET